MFRRLALAALAPAALGAMFVASPAEAAVVPVASLQADIAKLTNVQRKAKGCGAVAVNAKLTVAARQHSAWMAKTGKFSHTGSAGSSFVTRIKAAGYTKPASENIAWGYRTANEVVNAWMKSPGHRANILNCKAKTVGVGAVYSANGTGYFTQNFGY
ncbi:CAP domain-containing protein [Actinoplanes sp. NEAU-A12]|uniref:CAP domain-containing protein n=1 Tax=Actinoplanes sandaracinus TaxID=3045177 RepID=A0ABT6WD59_9ACTN|nr:CAP domain-containing protein [Actinoplanes sandaracinus]MDI6097650.1 CAP domain-containing protein [Actinoplanes sandaracinus]